MSFATFILMRRATGEAGGTVFKQGNAIIASLNVQAGEFIFLPAREDT
jgi:hypothetical protein